MFQWNKVKKTAWNKGKIVGQKLPLKPEHIWGIRIHLEMEGKIRDLALFNLALDSKLRGCDLVKLKVKDIAVGNEIKSNHDLVYSSKKQSNPLNLRSLQRLNSLYPHGLVMQDFAQWITYSQAVSSLTTTFQHNNIPVL